MALLERDGVDLDVLEPGGVEQLVQAVAIAERERAGNARRRRGDEPALDEQPRRQRQPRVVRRVVPHGKRDAPAGAQNAAGLRQRRAGVGHEHESPAAQDGVDARDRQVDPLRIDGLELDVSQAELRGARPRAVEHRLRLIGCDDASPRLHELGGQEARLADAGGEVEHPVPRLRVNRLDHPVGHRRPEGAHPLLAPRPAGRSLVPVLGACATVFLGVHQGSSRRNSLPDGVRGSGPVTTSTRRGTL